MKKLFGQQKLTVLFSYMLVVPTKNQLLNQRISLLFVHTLVLKKGYTFNVFWAKNLNFKNFKKLAKSMPRQLQMVLGNRGQLTPSYWRPSGWPAADPDGWAHQFLKYNSKLYCTLLFHFFGFFQLKCFWPYLPCFSIFFKFFF